MLHSAIPRTFLPPPGLCYLGGYYGETVNPYSSITRFVPLENAYASISSHHNEFSRSVSPIPLDLSVKSLPVSQSLANEDCETIEVDDVEDNREDDGFASDKNYPEVWSNGLGSEEHLSSPVSGSYSNYDDRHQETEKIRESSLGYHFASPKTLRSIQNYPQQLLLTPQQHSLQGINAPMTPPSTPSPPQCPRRRPRDEEEACSNLIATPKSSTIDKPNQRPKKKHARRLKFDEDTSSPVSGTVILGPDEAVVTGDIDPAFNIVEVTEEARAELAKIENRLGPYQCKLCRQLHEDAFQLAQHRCSRIAHVEYRCPECDKRFSCPANLASHRRWHKPRIPSDNAILSNIPNSTNERDISCGKCDAKFTRQAALRKHLLTQHPEMTSNISINNNNNNNNNNNDNDRNNNDDSNTNANNVSMERMRGTLSSPKAMISSLPLGGDSQSTEMA